MSNEAERIRLLEQKIEVITREFNEVVNEMQQATVSILDMVRLANQVMDQRLGRLEKMFPPAPPVRESGVEL